MTKIERWLTILTNLGVMVGLVLVAYQIDQTNTAMQQEDMGMQLAAFAASPDIMGDFRMRVIENEELWNLWIRGNAGESLTDSERARYELLVEDYLMRWSQLFGIFDSFSSGRGGFVVANVIQDLQNNPGLLEAYSQVVRRMNERNSFGLFQLPSDPLVTNIGFWRMLEEQLRSRSLVE